MPQACVQRNGLLFGKFCLARPHQGSAMRMQSPSHVHWILPLGLLWVDLQHLRWPLGNVHPKNAAVPGAASAGHTLRIRSRCGAHAKHVNDSLTSLSHSLCWPSPVWHRHWPRVHREHGPARVGLSWTHVVHWHHGHSHGRRLTLREVIPLHALCVRCLHLGHLHASSSQMKTACLPGFHPSRLSKPG